MVGRRDFLKASTLAGVSAGALGCAGRNEGLLVVPGETLSVQNMEAYLARLDSSMHMIATAESPIPQFFPKGKFDKNDPVLKKGDELLRKNMRSLMLVGSFKDLPEEGRVYPGMQNRLWTSMNEMDEAMLGMHKAVKELTPTERVEIGRALKADPDLGMRIIGAIDEEAGKFGVSMERRMHLRSLAAQACARLKQSSTMFLDEYVTKTEKVMTRSLDPEDVQRQLMASIGEKEFFAMRDRHERYIERWQIAQASTDPQSTNGSWIQKPAQEIPGTGAIKVGAVLLGVGVLVFGLGAIMVAAGNEVGLFVGTVGALLGIGGLITLIVGAIVRAVYS